MDAMTDPRPLRSARTTSLVGALIAVPLAVLVLWLIVAAIVATTAHSPVTTPPAAASSASGTAR